MLTLCGAEINLVALRQHQLSVTRGQMNKRFGLNSTKQNRPDGFFKRLLEWISMVRSSVHSMGFWEVPAKSSVGSWAGIDQLIPLSVLWPLKDTGPLGPRRSSLAASANCVLQKYWQTPSKCNWVCWCNSYWCPVLLVWAAFLLEAVLAVTPIYTFLGLFQQSVFY